MVLENHGNDKSKLWIHSRDSLLKSCVYYTAKFIGKTEVSEAQSLPALKAALHKLSFLRQIKRTEGEKAPKVEIGISIHSITISDIKTNELLHCVGLNQVSFCADDHHDKRLFGFVAKLRDGKRYCYGLDSAHQANDITLTIGQAFDITNKSLRKEKPTTGRANKDLDMNKRIRELESENDELRLRIVELEAAQRRVQNGGGSTSMQSPVACRPAASPQSTSFSSSIMAAPRRSLPTLAAAACLRQEPVDAFNMQPFLPTGSVARLPQPPSRKTANSQADLWPGDPSNPMRKRPGTRNNLMDIQNALSRGFVNADENLTLESFDPLKH